MRLDKKQKIFVLIIIVLGILKLLLVSNLPILSEVALAEDDELMIKLADNIVKGKWLGKYGTNTLLKGISFPVFLVICYLLHIRYIFAVSLFYVIACMIFTYVANKFIKNKIVVLLLYISLLFHPIMSCYQVLQRVYRNSIVISLALIIMASVINYFLIRKESFKKKIPTMLVFGFSFTMFWYTREDSMWILPFTIFMFVASIFPINKSKWKELLIFLVPISIFLIITNINCLLNYLYYGVYTIHNDSAYNKVCDTMKKVKSNVEIERVSYTREKLDRIAKVSPAMQVIKPDLDKLLDGYAQFDGNPSNTELEDGWFRFAFVGAVKENGYCKFATKEKEFYNQLNSEIEEALANGSLEKETKKTNYVKIAKDMVKTTYQSVKYIMSYEDIDFNLEKGSTEYIKGGRKKYNRFLKITRDRNLFIEESYIEEGEEPLVDFEEQAEYIKRNEYKEFIIKALIKIYKFANMVLVPFGIISYIVLTVKVIIEIINKKYESLEKWVILSAILGAIVTLILGIAYCAATIFNSISSLYLCSVYPLLIAFSIISIYNCVEFIKIGGKKC